ncbi:serine/threonine-protein kinase [Iamia sp.]|uniref:serine/threonine-protein kinase n=1 Tax=Iamia sp. TaxID=2722710 RepID=UPI002BB541C1|nr:serine/threonine-protein kinase [Iamia sp.]HXH55747.1 serine/threonine-protein kinase [Iamia sp.]
MTEPPPVPGGPLPAIPGVDRLVAIGKGGFGVVYRGRQGEFGRDVAVKVLLAHGADERAVELWGREITAMGRLSNHPNIVAVYSAGVTNDGHPYLLMPFVGGGSLHERLRDQGPLPGDDVVRVGVRLAGGLAAAHDAGVLHRDVKPANVLMSEYGEPQLSDFGIARLVDAATTTTGSVRATIGYAAPEVLSGETASPASDVYGLGATLHAALAGRAPFAGPGDEPFAARIGRVMTQPPPDLRALGVAPGLAEVIEAALAKDPADRPQSADELRRRLVAVDSTAAKGGGASVGPASVLGAAALGAAAAADPGEAESDSPTSVYAAAPAPAPSTPAPSTPAPSTSAPSTAVADPVPTPPDDERPAGRRRGATLALAVVALFLFSGLGVWALTRSSGDDEGDRVNADTTEATTTEAPDEPTTTDAPDEPTTTEAPDEPTTTEAPAPPEPPPPPEPDADDESSDDDDDSDDDDEPSGGELRDAVTDYYALVDGGDLRAAHAQLSPGFQGRQPFGDYQRFWSSIESVTVQGRSEADVEAMTVATRLRYVRTDGSRSDENVLVTFIEGPEGTLLIDQYQTGVAG